MLVFSYLLDGGYDYLNHFVRVEKQYVLNLIVPLIGSQIWQGIEAYLLLRQWL